MGKLFFPIMLAIASFALVESLVCSKCSVGVFGVCLNSDNVTCTGNETVCYTARATFPSITGFNGFSNQGCRANDPDCNRGVNSTLLGITYSTTIACCSTEKCNPVTLSGAPSTKMTFTAAITGAVLASFLSSML